MVFLFSETWIVRTARIQEMDRFRMNFRFFIIFITVIGFCDRAGAEGCRLEKDRDGDGKIDPVFFYNEAEKIQRIEIDSNKDGLMDHFQIYQDEKLLRVERDTDCNGRSYDLVF